MSRPRHTCKPGLYITSTVFKGSSCRGRIRIADSLSSPHAFLTSGTSSLKPDLSIMVQTVAASSHKSTSYGSGRVIHFAEVTKVEDVRPALLRALEVVQRYAWQVDPLPEDWSRYLATPFVVCLACQRRKAR